MQKLILRNFQSPGDIVMLTAAVRDLHLTWMRDNVGCRIHGGERLDEDIRAQMEGWAGRSLADIRVHTDPDAAKSVVVLNANAYTTGHDIYFAAGKYAASRSDRNQLLAHELVHTVQAQRSEA